MTVGGPKPKISKCNHIISVTNGAEQTEKGWKPATKTTKHCVICLILPIEITNQSGLSVPSVCWKKIPLPTFISCAAHRCKRLSSLKDQWSPSQRSIFCRRIGPWAPKKEARDAQLDSGYRSFVYFQTNPYDMWGYYIVCSEIICWGIMWYDMTDYDGVGRSYLCVMFFLNKYIYI